MALHIVLPCNHTNGTKPNFPTPRAMVADNDLALGQIVEAVSRSKFWRDTCIFVVEDDPVMLRMVGDYLEQHNMQVV